MSSHAEASDKSSGVAMPDFATIGAQLCEMIGKFNELSIEMAAQRQGINHLVSNQGGGVLENPEPQVDNPPSTVAQN